MQENRETSGTPAVKPGSRSAGEGLGRTARVYVCEESHCVIVPMNHSNKDGASSAESEEGRLRLKENTLLLDTYPTPSGTERVSGVGECANRLCLAAIYPREEPDALMSARPDLCGGHRAAGVPTAIANDGYSSATLLSWHASGKKNSPPSEPPILPHAKWCWCELRRGIRSTQPNQVEFVQIITQT